MVGATASGHASIVEDSDFPQELPSHLAPFDDAPNATTTLKDVKEHHEEKVGGSNSGSHGTSGEHPTHEATDSQAKAATSPSSSSLSSSTVLGEDQAFVCGPGLVMSWRLTEFKEKETATPAKAAKSSLFHRLYGEAPSLEEVVEGGLFDLEKN